MYVIIKQEHHDFNSTTEIKGVTASRTKALEKFKELVEAEKELQKKFNIKYDTIEEEEDSYEAYNEGYEATDSISFFIDETEEIEANETTKYEKLVNDIQTQYEYWKKKYATTPSIESEVRFSEYGRLQALIIGLEKE